MRLALFDVDKTLIKDNRGHKESFRDAFKEVFKIDDTIESVDHQGKSDQWIIREVLKKNGLDEEKIKAKIMAVMEAMTESFARRLKDDKVEIVDGVADMLRELKKNNVLIGLVTGNLESIAKGKMEKIGLGEYFEVGGYGSDSYDRGQIVKIAIKRAEKMFPSIDKVFVFGDTPYDIAAGKEAGAVTIGVATGDFSISDLEKTGADLVVKNMKDTSKITEFVLGV